MFERFIENKFVLIIARAIDYRIGRKDNDVPDVPILSVREAMVSLLIKLLIFLINFITCLFVIANVIHHW